VPLGAFGACDAADVNGDGVVDELDLAALVRVLFGSAPVPR
jgi:hypothetical protein